MDFIYRKTSISSEEIVPDLTVKSASSTNILTRFPSDLLETSVDPDNDIKISIPSDTSKSSNKNPKLAGMSTSEELESLEQNLDVIDSHQNQFDLDCKQEHDITKEDVLKPIDSTKSHEINSVFESKDRSETLNAPTDSLINTEHQIIRKAEIVSTRNVHVTTSTLESINHSTNLDSSLKKTEETTTKLTETDNYTRSSLFPQYTEHVNSDLISNSPPKANLDQKFQEHDSKCHRFDLAKEVNFRVI